MAGISNLSREKPMASLARSAAGSVTAAGLGDCSDTENLTDTDFPCGICQPERPETCLRPGKTFLLVPDASPVFACQCFGQFRSCCSQQATMLPIREQATFLIADITGYTKFLAAIEIAHDRPPKVPQHRIAESRQHSDTDPLRLAPAGRKPCATVPRPRAKPGREGAAGVLRITRLCEPTARGPWLHPSPRGLEPP